MISVNILNRDGTETPVCYPTKISIREVVLGKKVDGGSILLDVELEITKMGWIARSRAGTAVIAERAGKLRDKSQFIA